MSAKPPPPPPPTRPGKPTQPAKQPGPRVPTKPAGPKTTGLMYSVRTLAQMWECSVDHIYDLIAAGKLKATPLGLRGRAKTRISDAAVLDFIARGGAQ